MLGPNPLLNHKLENNSFDIKELFFDYVSYKFEYNTDLDVNDLKG